MVVVLAEARVGRFRNLMSSSKDHIDCNEVKSLIRFRFLLYMYRVCYNIYSRTPYADFMPDAC